MNRSSTSPQPALTPRPGQWRRCVTTILCAALTATAVPLAWAQPESAAARGDRGRVTLNFVDAEIATVARAMAAILQRNIVIDPRVKGTMNLSNDQPVTVAQAQTQFLSALRLSGYTMVSDAGLYKIIPEADAKLQSSAVVGPGLRTPRDGEVVTQIFRLNYENAANLVPILRPLISPNNTININPSNNSLVITDYAGNLSRLAQMIATLDVPQATDVDVIPLRYAIASDVAALVQQLIGSDRTTTQAARGNAAATPSSGSGYPTTVLADARSNALLVRAANAAQLSLARSLILRLDQPPAIGTPAAGNIHVVYLKNADAVAIAQTLRAALASSSGNEATQSSGGASTQTTSAAATPANAATASSASTSGNTSSSSTTAGGLANSSMFGGNGQTVTGSTGGQIQADTATNSLIISAPDPVYRQLRAVIDQLDERRAQVYVEALIAEVSADNGTDLGVQWLGLAGSSSQGYVGGGTNFGSTGNILDVGTAIYSATQATTSSAQATAISNATANLAQGFTIGLYRSSLAVLAQALETKAKANILSTPTLTTLDNQEARILIGQNIPVATGSYSSTSSSSTVTPFTTYDRMDVGLTLDIKPQINADGSIKMQIYQEVSSLSGSLGSSSTTTDSSNVVTNKRTLSTTVQVQDGSTVVLGGLMQDQVQENRSQVPVLGDIPYLGALFRSRSTTHSKTNLMIFLRPVVLRTAEATNSFSLSRYDQLRTIQQQQPLTIRRDNAPSGPVLPDLSGQAPQSATVPSGMPIPTPTSTPSPQTTGTDAPQS